MPDDEMMKLISQIILRSGYHGNEVERVLAVSRNMDLASKVARHGLLKGQSLKNEERPFSDVVRGAAIYGAAMNGDFAGDFRMVDANSYEFSLRLGGNEINLLTECRSIPTLQGFHCKYDTGPMEIDLFVSTMTAFGAKVRERYHLGSLADSLQGKDVWITVDIDGNGLVAITVEEDFGVDASFGKIKDGGFRQEFVPELENLVDENKAVAPAPVTAKEPTQSEAPNFEDARKIMLDLLPVFDSFDRSLAAAKGGNTGLRQGMELIERQLLTGLKKNGLERIESEGKMFDPNYHEAVAMVTDKGKEDGSVAAELEKGYLYKGKVLRPSRVSVVTDD